MLRELIAMDEWIQAELGEAADVELIVTDEPLQSIRTWSGRPYAGRMKKTVKADKLRRLINGRIAAYFEKIVRFRQGGGKELLSPVGVDVGFARDPETLMPMVYVSYMTFGDPTVRQDIDDPKPRRRRARSRKTTVSRSA